MGAIGTTSRDITERPHAPQWGRGIYVIPQ